MRKDINWIKELIILNPKKNNLITSKSSHGFSLDLWAKAFDELGISYSKENYRHFIYDGINNRYETRECLLVQNK